MGGVDKANQMNGSTADGMANQTRVANRANSAHDANRANRANRANGNTGARQPRRPVPRALTGEDAYKDGKLTRPAMVSLVILTFITFVGNFTQLQLTSALPTIVSEFHISVTTGQWLTSVFQLVMGVMVPLTAFLTKRFSTRRIVIVSMVAFTIGSVLGWLADSFVLVLLGRLIEAAGTGVMWPVLQIVVFSVFPVTKRGVAMGTVGLAMSIAPAVGPTLGGWQTDTNGWRSIFLSLAVIGLLCLVAASLWLHDFGEHDETVRTDFLSVVLSVFGFGGLLFGFTNIETYPITHPMCWVPMAVGVVGIAWFITRQLRREDPLLDLRVLKNRSFTFGTATASLAFFAFSSIFVVIPLFIQDDRGYSATMSGLIMLPGAIGMAISQLFGGRALDRFGARPIVVSGGLILLLGTIGMSMISMTSPMWWVSVCQLVRQIGMGFVLMPVTTWSLNCLAAKDVSAGSAVTNTMRQIAGAVGSPVLVIAMESFARMWQRHGMGAVEASVWGIKCSLWMSSAITFAMVVCIFVGVRGEGAGSGREMSLRALRRLRRR